MVDFPASRVLPDYQREFCGLKYEFSTRNMFWLVFLDKTATNFARRKMDSLDAQHPQWMSGIHRPSAPFRNPVTKKAHSWEFLGLMVLFPTIFDSQRVIYIYITGYFIYDWLWVGLLPTYWDASQKWSWWLYQGKHMENVGRSNDKMGIQPSKLTWID